MRKPNESAPWPGSAEQISGAVNRDRCASKGLSTAAVTRLASQHSSIRRESDAVYMDSGKAMR
jgi:hypothetical protein